MPKIAWVRDVFNAYNHVKKMKKFMITMEN